MRQVWKYDVPVDDQAHAIRVPAGAAPLHVACQGSMDVMQVWYLVDAAQPVEGVRLRVFGTGTPIPGGAAWLGTALAAEGRLVWHLFELEGGAW